MISESARATAAAESRFRIADRNSKPRSSRVIALDEASETVLTRIAGFPWVGTRFLRFVEAKELVPKPFQFDAVLRDEEGKLVDLTSELRGADVAVMIVSAGQTAGAASVIGNACHVRNIMTSGMIIAQPGVDASPTLRDMRPYAAMLVVGSDEEFIPEMLRALRA